MFKLFRTPLVLLLVSMALVAACIPQFQPTARPVQLTPDQSLIETAAAGTVSAIQTQVAVETLVAQLTVISKQLSVTPLVVTATPLPETATATPVPATATPLPTNTSTPTVTPLPPTATRTPGRPTATLIPCYWVGFVADITIPDGAVLKPNESFRKIWRLKNIGSCTWTSDFALSFHSGTPMSAPDVKALGVNVLPGQTVDVSVDLVAPAAEGSYTANFWLRNSDGVPFGWGAKANSPFWVKIVVQKQPSRMDPAAPLDYAFNYCNAVWTSTAGVLPCPGSGNDFTNGSITRTSSPVLEGGYQDDEVTLVMVPSNGSGGFIAGRYPAVSVQSGDRFEGLIGCLNNSPACTVTFRLDYRIDSGAVHTLQSWTEVYDGHWTRVSVDLSGLAGKNVEFILRVDNNDGSSRDDRAFWMVPKIRR